MKTMDHTSRFDEWLDNAYGARHVSSSVLDAIRDSSEALKGAWLAVQREFGEKAQPEHALALLRFVESDLSRRSSTSHSGTSSIRDA